MTVTQPSAASVPAVRPRVRSVDILRGAVMVLMAIDHVRVYSVRRCRRTSDGRLPLRYLVLVLVVAILYVPCRWYAALEARRRDWWLRYL